MNLIKIVTVDNHDLIDLVKELDRELHQRNGGSQLEYNQFNSILTLSKVVVLYVNEKPVGCGGYKAYNDVTVEIKRMFVLPSYRGNGISKEILFYLETLAKTEGYLRIVLETGSQQKEAISLYKKCNYQQTENYGQYLNMPNSLCFAKDL